MPARLGVIFEFMEQVGTSHPDVDHWHLPGIDVDPRRQVAGVGSLLLAHTLAEIQAGDSPTIWPMLRPANRST